MPVQVAVWPKQFRPGLQFHLPQKMELYLLRRFDAQTMVDNPKVSASTGMVDDGTGVKEVSTIKHQTVLAKYPHLSRDTYGFPKNSHLLHELKQKFMSWGQNSFTSVRSKQEMGMFW